MVQKEYTFKAFNFSSQIIRDLVEKKDTVSPFLGEFFSSDNILNQISKKSFSNNQRLQLVDRLAIQNEKIVLTSETQRNLEKLKSDTTFTITTGHQLNLMTGPLYSLYKVAQVIKIAQDLSSKSSVHHFVPVFWMATEDHDFEEINHIHLFGQKIAWEKEGQTNKIVGEIIPKNFEPFIDQISEKFREDHLKSIIQRFGEAYTESKSLATATRWIMNELFGDYGLIIIDGNDPVLKQQFKPIVKKEIQEGFVAKKVKETNLSLENAGYHQQVFVRDCNLFYIDENDERKRIAKIENGFELDDTFWSEEDLLNSLEEHPEKFSPNALMRPIYQEIVLPNLAYVGGGGEIAYWLQLQAVFEEIELTFPLLRVRDSFILLKERELRELEELNFEIVDLKRDMHALLKEIALNEVEEEITLSNEVIELNKIKDIIVGKAENINQGLVGMVEAEFVKMVKSVERIESKLIKAEKSKHDKKGKKIEKLQAKIFPNGGFQERYENFLPYYLNDTEFVHKIIDNLPAEDEPKIRILID